MSKTIIVTGVAGFIGMSVAKELMARGDRVIGIDNLNVYYSVDLKRARLAELAPFGVAFDFLERDFADYAALSAALARKDFGSIIHLGAQPGVRYSIENPHAYVQSNLVGHLNMLEIARHRGVEHMVYASSSSVYGENEAMPFRVEDRVDHPVSLYAATKKADELMSESYAHLYRLPQTGLRFFTVYGPWGRPDMAVWLFTDAILAGRPIKLFNEGRMLRDFTFIDDIVAGVIAAHDSPPADDGAVKAGGSRKPHRVWNIGNNKPEPLMDLLATIESACGRAAQYEMLPMQAGDVPATYADISAIQAETDFVPSTPIASGVPQFVDWFVKYHR